MNSHKLRFGEIIILKKNLAEVIINRGILFDTKMVKEYHAFLLANLEAPFSLLINKKFSYTYSFEAQNEIANLEEINALAVVTDSFNARVSTKFLISVNSKNQWNIKTFRFRNEALVWLEQQE